MRDETYHRIETHTRWIDNDFPMLREALSSDLPVSCVAAIATKTADVICSIRNMETPEMMVEHLAALSAACCVLSDNLQERIDVKV